MKKVTISIIDPSLNRVLGEDFPVQVPDDGDFLDAIAEIDKGYLKNPIKAKRSDVTIHSVLQLVWNASKNAIFDDVGIEARDPDKEWLPVKENPFLDLPDGTSIITTPDIGC